MKVALFTLFTGIATMLLFPGSAAAQETQVLRVVMGDAQVPRSYSIAELRDLPSVELETSTPWTEGLQRFAGVPLHVLIEGADEGDVLILRALNDYTVTIPVADVGTEEPILAYERNGAPMSIRDKGPLWLIYPFDQNPRYQTETNYSRSIWQLVEIEVEATP